jgi:hypothetical protein
MCDLAECLFDPPVVVLLEHEYWHPKTSKLAGFMGVSLLPPLYTGSETGK